LEVYKRENSILASQLREMQEEIAETSNISKIQNKNLSSLEITNNMLSERVNNLENEKMRLMSLVSDQEDLEENNLTETDNQIQVTMHGIRKLKNKNNKLKEVLNLKTNQCIEFETEIYRLSQVIEGKDKEISNVIEQYQELKNTIDTDNAQKDTLFLERIKSKILNIILKVSKRKIQRKLRNSKIIFRIFLTQN